MFNLYKNRHPVAESLQFNIFKFESCLNFLRVWFESLESVKLCEQILFIQSLNFDPLDSLRPALNHHPKIKPTPNA